MGQFDQSANEAKLAAALSAIGAGGAEQSRLFNLAQQGRQQGINEQLLERTQPINELAAILQGSPAVGQPQFGQQAQYQVAPADVMGAQQMAYGGQMNAYNAANQYNAAGMGGLYSLGGAVAGALPWASWLCSRQFKENGRDPYSVLGRVNDLTVEAWEYKGDKKTHISPYAEEFHEMFGVGDGVTIHPVDAFGVCLLAIKELTHKVETLEGLCRS